MKNKNILIYIIFLIGILLYSSCNSNLFVNTSSTCTLDTNLPLKHFYCQYEILDWNDNYYPIFYDVNYAEMISAYDAARITILVNVQNPGPCDSLFIPHDSDNNTQMTRDIRIFNNNNKVYNDTFPDGYLYGLDSAHAILVGEFVGAGGLTAPGICSLVFVAKCTDGYPQKEGVVVHELGHQIGVQGHFDHGGCGVDYCIMNSPIIPEMYNDIHFCEFHMDSLYLCAKPNQTGFLASQYKNNFSNKIIKNGNFSFFILMPKDTLLECQPIHMNIHIKNLNNFDDSLLYFEDWSNISVKNENTGKNLKPMFFADALKNTYMYFKAGEEKIYESDLMEEFGNVNLDQTKDKNKSNLCYYIPSGEYSVSLNENGYISNKLIFNIVKPEGQDKSDLETLKDAFLTKGSRSHIDKFYNFLIEHSNSQYYELALEWYNAFFNNFISDDYINLITVCNKWFERDTESDFAKYLIRCLGSVYKTSYKEAKEKIQNYLNEIVLEYPNTIISIWSKPYIELLKNNK